METNRNELRKAIFAGNKPKTKEVELNGAIIELRSPQIGDLLAGDEVDTLKLLIKCAYVPGTDERVFEDGDYEHLQQFYYDECWSQVVEAMAEITNLKGLREEQKK